MFGLSAQDASRLWVPHRGFGMRSRHRLTASPHMQLLQDLLHVLVDGGDRNVQTPGDLSVGVPAL
jgi:hypothetical protein